MIAGHDTHMQVNRTGWDLRTPFHASSTFYALSNFRFGAITLCPPECELVGNVAGLRLLHLQCHFGLDTLSWARLGAVSTGVDFSPIALDRARLLSREIGVTANFVEADVQRLDDTFAGSFDLVVTSYGVLCWLSDLPGWAAGIRKSLRIGGRFVLVEYHPILDVLNNGKISGHKQYFGAGAHIEQACGTYADHSAPISYLQCRWQHPISEVMMALVNAGLSVAQFHEYPYSSYKLFPELDQQRNGVWYDSTNQSRKPFMYSIVAHAR
jgi:SAM-dependent methyltransferase